METLFDTNILVHAHNRASPLQKKAGEVIVKANKGELQGYISPQILYEFFAAITDGRRVEKPLSPGRQWRYALTSGRRRK